MDLVEHRRPATTGSHGLAGHVRQLGELAGNQPGEVPVAHFSLPGSTVTAQPPGGRSYLVQHPGPAALGAVLGPPFQQAGGAKQLEVDTGGVGVQPDGRACFAGSNGLVDVPQCNQESLAALVSEGTISRSVSYLRGRRQRRRFRQHEASSPGSSVLAAPTGKGTVPLLLAS